MMFPVKQLVRTLNNLYNARILYEKADEDLHKDSREAIKKIEEVLRYENGTLSPPLIKSQKYIFNTLLWREKEFIQRTHSTTSRFFHHLGTLFMKSSAAFPSEEKEEMKLESLHELKLRLEEKKDQCNQGILETVIKEIKRLQDIDTTIDERKQQSFDLVLNSLNSAYSQGVFDNHPGSLETIRKEILQLKNSYKIQEDIRNHEPTPLNLAIQSQALTEVQNERLVGAVAATAGVAAVFFTLGHLSYYLKDKAL